MAIQLDFDKVCIICLIELEDMVSIFDRDDINYTIAEKITKCYPGFNFDEVGNRPDKICSLCLEDLAAAFRFKNNCETAILVFRSVPELSVGQSANTENTEIHDLTHDGKEEVELLDTENDEYDEFCELEELEYEDEQIKNEFDETLSENTEEANAEVNPQSSNIPSLPTKDTKTVKQKRVNNKTPKVFNPKQLKKPKKKSTHGPKICDLCGNSYKFQHALNAHMRRHTNVRPYSCECCEKAFVSNVELRRHMRVHTGQKPYGCSYCDRRFSDYGSRIKHERTHTGERPFFCQTCNKSFAYSHVLSVHLRTHTGEKKFQCSQCGKGFTKKAYMLAHMEQHARSSLITVKDDEESQNVYIPYQTNSNNTAQDNSDESLQECLTTYIVEEIDAESCDMKVLQEVGTSQGNEFILGID